MYGIALPVTACLRAGTSVHVGWVVDTHGFSARGPSDAVAITPGGGRVGSLVGGALDQQLAELAGPTGRMVHVHVGEVDAAAAGLSCGGDATCLLVPATDLPEELWPLLVEREPVCLVSRLDGDRVLSTDLEPVPERATVSSTTVEEDRVVTVLWPVPRLVIVGAGAVPEALAAAAGLLGWQVQAADDAQTATGLIAGLAATDKLVVTSHDLEVAGPSLAAALEGDVGYIGALGSRRTQQHRADWLADRGITDLDRVHGPAGLDIGSETAAEIAVSILAEALAVAKGRRRNRGVSAGWGRGSPVGR